MKTLTFMKRNLKEMTRDPLIYIFCAGFPIFMVLMFQIILKYTGENTPIFEVKSLIPGINDLSSNTGVCPSEYFIII